MRGQGITVPLFASDGPGITCFQWIDVMLPTSNSAQARFLFWRKYIYGGPCMCTEFWIGWFDAWRDEKHHKGNMEIAAKELEELLELGNVNFYMFEGGTNFGFMNGSNYEII